MWTNNFHPHEKFCFRNFYFEKEEKQFVNVSVRLPNVRNVPNRTMRKYPLEENCEKKPNMPEACNSQTNKKGGRERGKQNNAKDIN